MRPSASSAPSSREQRARLGQRRRGRRIEEGQGGGIGDAPGGAVEQRGRTRSAARISGRREGLAARRSRPPPTGGSRRPARCGRRGRGAGRRRRARRARSRAASGRCRARSAARGRARESTTTRTPSMVSEVSAMEVASTTLRRPGRRGPHGAVLLGAVQRAVERRDVDGRVARRARASALATRRISPCAGQEDEDRAGLARAARAGSASATSSSMRRRGSRPR